MGEHETTDEFDLADAKIIHALASYGFTVLALFKFGFSGMQSINLLGVISERERAATVQLSTFSSGSPH
jgi:hypothetical protein